MAGLEVARLSRTDVADIMFASLQRGRGGWLVTANVDFLWRCADDAAALALYSRADLILADGVPLLWAGSLRGEPFPERVAGSDLVWDLA